MTAVVIGIDPHKSSNTALVLDPQENVLAKQRFPKDRDGYRQLKHFARPWRERTWAVEGARGVGLGLAQRIAADGERVLNVPARLYARVRALGGNSGRKTDDADAYAVAVAGLRGRNLEVVEPDEARAVLKLLSDRRQQLVDQRIMAVNRLHQLLAELLPGGAERRLTPIKARQLLSAVRPRDQVGKARRQLALDHAKRHPPTSVAAVEDPQLGGRVVRPGPGARSPRWHRVLRHPHGAQRGPVNPRRQHQTGVEHLDRQRLQQRLLDGVVSGNGPQPRFNPAPVIDVVHGDPVRAHADLPPTQRCGPGSSFIERRFGPRR